MAILNSTVASWIAADTNTRSAQVLFYNIIYNCLDVFGKLFPTSSTHSVQSLEIPEPELIPYECCHASGSLDFWHEPMEDIYTKEDGEPL